MEKHFGIDISSYNKNLNYRRLKQAGVEFIIIRLGIGQDQTNQDDFMFEKHIKGCEEAGIPYGLYFYSYALNLDMIDGEINHALRLAKKCNPTLGIWFDMEDDDNYKANRGFFIYKESDTITAMCEKFCDAMIAAGYKTGIYASFSLFKVMNEAYKKYRTWVACWGSTQPTSIPNMQMWQCNGSEDGIVVEGSTNANDLNYWFGNLPGEEPQPKPKPQEEEMKFNELRLCKLGDVNVDVKVIQCVVGTNVDGIFGTKTEDAVIAFQRANNLVADGIVGEKTWAKIFSKL